MEKSSMEKEKAEIKGGIRCISDPKAIKRICEELLNGRSKQFKASVEAPHGIDLVLLTAVKLRSRWQAVVSFQMEAGHYTIDLANPVGIKAIETYALNVEGENGV